MKVYGTDDAAKEVRTLQVKDRPLNVTRRYASPRWIILTLAVIMLAFILIWRFASGQRGIIVEYAEYTASRIADQTADEVGTVIAYAGSSIKGVATSVAANMTGPELEDPEESIRPLLENSPFGSIEYIRPDGMNVMNPGEPFDASDRVYYQEGIKGNTGIWNNHHPKVSKETLVNFYTPLIYDGEISGVITGYVEANAQIRPMMMNEFFGHTLYGLILDENDMVVCTTDEKEFVPDQTFNMLLSETALTGAQQSELIMLSRSETDGAIVFHGPDGAGRLAVREIPETGWRVIMIIPASSFDAVAGESSRSMAVTLGQISLILVVYFTMLSIGILRDRRRTSKENAKLEEENQLFNEENRRAFEDLRRANASLERQQEELEKAWEEANVANKAKSSFLFGMSHDIRTPMNAILGYAGLMEKELENPEKLQDYLKKITISGDYLLSLINNVLEVARIDSGAVSLNERLVDLLDDEWAVLPFFENDLSKKDLSFTCDMNIQHRYIYADMPKIKEIMMNLVSNAIKYTPDGGKIHMHFEEYPSEREGYAIYENSISDTGIGMSREFQEHIFESFSREHDTTESKISGTGLGMAIVKRLTDIMGGTILLESEPGKGSCFTVRLEHRIASEETTDAMEAPAPSAEKKLDLTGKRILLVEDNEMNAEIATAILEETGARIEWADDGDVCVEMVSKAPAGYFDLILMDVQMPRMNGYTATREIRKLEDSRKAGIPIIAITANAFDEDRKNAFDAGMNGHVAKPIHIPELAAALRTILDGGSMGE